MGIIYKIKNVINDKIYVGRDKHNNPKYMGSGVILQQAFKKYGIENFKKEIIEECENSLLDEREKYWIKILNSQDKTIGYNIAEGGHNDFTMNEYVKLKISKTLKGKYVGEKAFRHGIKLSPSHKENFTKNANKMKGKTFEEFYGKEKAKIIKNKISESHIGMNFSKKHCESISKAKKGILLSETHKNKISNALMGRIVKKETKEKLSISNLNKTQKYSIKLECKNIITGEILTFNNVEHAKRELCCTRYKLLQNKLKNYNVRKLE